MSPDNNPCLYHICNLYFNFLFLQTERIYFQVFLPKGSKEKSKPMFFCHRWSVGKAIDFAAALASLKNDNNKFTAKVTTRCSHFSLQGLGCAIQACLCGLFLSSQKLRLCHVTSGQALPLDHTLESWMAKEACPLHSGGNVILEYLSDDEQFLKDIDSYFEQSFRIQARNHSENSTLSWFYLLQIVYIFIFKSCF